MLRFYILSGWVVGLFWILCRLVFPTNPDIKKNLPLVLFNQGVQTAGLVYSAPYFSRKFYPDSYQTMIAHLGFFIWVEEILFFHIHRFFHSRWIYKLIHHIHHRYRESYADVALYTHPLEHILCNGFPVMVGPILLQSDFTTTSVWFTLVIINACWTHSGTNAAEIHDIHHKNSNYNYGVLSLMDLWNGTLLTRKKNIN